MPQPFAAIPQIPFSIELPGANMRGVDMSRLDFSDADLRQTDFRDANLSGADFRNAQLGGAILCGADLTGARNLTAAQIAVAQIDARTRLPDDLAERPRRGPCGGDAPSR